MINLTRLHVVCMTDKAKKFKFINCQYTQTITGAVRTPKSFLSAFYQCTNRTPFLYRLL